MWSFNRSDDTELRRSLLALTVGAAGGLAVGLLLSRRRPGRRVRAAAEELELAALEDAVLDAFLNHELLRERGIDIGAITRGIVELSGSVQTEEEADLAVRVANAVPGVQTVVNRLEVEAERRQLEQTRRRFEDGDPALHETRWEGRRVGMGRMRQGGQTEPARPDESQHQVERALEKADRMQWEEEGLAAQRSRMSAVPEDERPGQRLRYRDDELDNQEPHGRRAARTLDEPPQELRSASRVGEGLKPGTELRLEDADVPLKPHSDTGRQARRTESGGPGGA